MEGLVVGALILLPTAVMTNALSDLDPKPDLASEVLHGVGAGDHDLVDHALPRDLVHDRNRVRSVPGPSSRDDESDPGPATRVACTTSSLHHE